MRRRKTPIGPVERPQDARDVDSLHRGLEVLRNFRPGESMLGINEISLRLGVPRATTQRLVDTLVTHKFVRQVGDSDRYQPDVSCLVVGHALVASSAIVRVARPIMQELASRFKVDVVLGTRERLDMLCLEHCASRNAARFPVTVGMSLPLTATALGRAWLWAQPGSLQGELIQRTKAEGGEQGMRTIPGLYRAFQEMEEHGYCLSSGEWLRDVNAVGTAVILNNGATYALSCRVVGLGSKKEFSLDEIGPALLEAAAKIKDAAGRIPP
jgi:DNA-binding IclR family transcriptional regulator